MMNFDDINRKFIELEQLVNIHLIPEAVELITLPIPYEPKDELYFNKLVSWGYSLIVESFPVLFKRLAGQVRQSDTDGFEEIRRSQIIILALRTIQSHNMPKNVPENVKKINLVDLWFEQNAPDSEVKWVSACDALCKILFNIVSRLYDVLNAIISDSSSVKELISKLSFALKNEWPAHSFDDYIELTAQEIGIVGINVVNYRNGKLKEWRALTTLFEDIDIARISIKRKIKAELVATFGQS
ncbi:hypothetical protein [Morganella morganii]|uniref:hypothetical protein n=1 Tax=Morganella morganii TaxID=582 RepID=UPI0032DBECB0